jgi:magnesium-transporting ATPase (P-type)
VVLKHPALYRQGRDNLDMNVSQVLQWLGYAVVHSLLVFWLPYASFSLKDTAWEPRTGYSQGIDVRGLAIFCAMTWAMQLSVSFSTLTWTRWNWGVIAFSQAVFYVFVAVLASSAAFSWDFVGVAARAFGSAPFYLNMGLSCAALTLLDVAVKGARLALAPQACETARVWHGLGVWREEDGSAPEGSSAAKNLTAPRSPAQGGW